VPYRFALRPLWLLSHLFVLGCVVAFVALGLWQLDRHDERRARNETVEARADLPVEAVGAALARADPDDLRFRTVSAEGRYRDEVLLVDNRSLGGLPGAWVLAPLVLDDGTTLVVNRGFRFAESGTGSAPSVPDGSVATWQGGSCGVRRDEAGEPVGTACLDRSATEEAFGSDVLPVVVQRQTSSPAEAADDLQPVPAPELDAGPHRSYAAQWFTFAALATVVYALILRRQARQAQTEDVTEVMSASSRS
jgi:surfeit locus 1 family protein